MTSRLRSFIMAKLSHSMEAVEGATLKKKPALHTPVAVVVPLCCAGGVDVATGVPEGAVNVHHRGPGDGHGGPAERLPRRRHKVPVSPQSHPSLTPVSPRSHPARSHPGLAPVSPRSHPDLTPVTPRFHPSLTPVSPRSHPGHTPVSPQSHPCLTPVSPLSHPGLAPWSHPRFRRGKMD